MITKEKNRTKIICAVVTAISAIVAGGSAFQLYNVQNISQTVNGNVIQILGETGSYVSAGTDLTDSTDELISAYRKVLDENSQYQANQNRFQYSQGMAAENGGVYSPRLAQGAERVKGVLGWGIPGFRSCCSTSQRSPLRGANYQ